jgi:hypothetical protein
LLILVDLLRPTGPALADRTTLADRSAWTRVTEPDGTPGEWYLHLFAPGQPDFYWASAEVRAEFADVLRFWFDRGADGIRIDSAALLTKDPSLRNVGPDEPPGAAHPYSDRDDVHEIYRSWPAIAEAYPGRVLIGEVWIPDPARLARYVSPGELHTVFNFPYLSCPWDAAPLREVIDNTLQLHAPVGAPATWVRRSALRICHAEPALGDGPMAWLPAYGGAAGSQAAGVLAFDRGSGVRCVCNLSSVPVDLPGHTGVLLASGPLADGQLPPDTTVWLRPAAGRQ